MGVKRKIIINFLVITLSVVSAFGLIYACLIDFTTPSHLFLYSPASGCFGFSDNVISKALIASFILTKMEHCVADVFYMTVCCEFNLPFLIIVIIGNLLGGFLIGKLFFYHNQLKP